MRIHRFVSLVIAAAALGACGKSQNNADTPLAFVPADTPYVYANLEPTPKAVTDHWSSRMQEYWPALFGVYNDLLTNSNKLSEHDRRIATALLDELKTHDSWDKLRAIGIKPDMRMAFYGVGMTPVLRIELGDQAAFKAEVERIEAAAGEKLAVAKTGAQEYWQIGNDKIVAMIAIEGSQLVATIAPAQASDTLKQTLLGVIRPAQSLAAAGTLETLAKQYGYSPYGEGYVDFAGLAARLSGPLAGSDLEIARTLGLPVSGSDAVCKSEYVDIAHKFPRLVAGLEELGTQRVRVGAQMEIEPGLAQQIAASLPAAPGSGEAGRGILDFSVALPILKLKDFWIKQADAVAAKPFACAHLAELNAGFAQMKSKLDVTIPPPASDLTGARFVLDKAEPRDGGMPDVAGKLLFGSNNPGAALAMAQLALPALKDFKLAADGKPVALPAGLAPASIPPLFAAMSDKAIAIGAGTGEDAELGQFLAAPAAKESVFLRMHFSGAIYGLMARFAATMKARLPADGQARIDQQSKLFAIYEKWIRSGDIALSATPTGIALHETVEQN
jgi:hypothetical protein